MTEVKIRPIKVWDEFKKVRAKYYKDISEAKEKGGLLWSGSGWSLANIPSGLGDDVYFLYGEPYAATLAWFKDYAAESQEYMDQIGVARDACSYLRVYWSSALRGTFILTDGTVVKYPEPNFYWTVHICDSHAKWYQHIAVRRGVPMKALDVCVGPGNQLNEKKIRYVVNQLHDSIKWMEKVTGREYSDELLIKRTYQALEYMCRWSRIVNYNKSVPAPIEEKSLFSFYTVFEGPWDKLEKEIQERVKKGLGALEGVEERGRILGDMQPPWPVLTEFYRYMEYKYGVNPIGSLYIYAIAGAWKALDEKGNFVWEPVKFEELLEKYELTNRDEALRATAETFLRHHGMWQTFYDSSFKRKAVLSMTEEWKADGMLLFMNRGCEGLAISQLDYYHALREKGFPVATWEGNFADPRDLDIPKIHHTIDTFMARLGINPLDSES
nr:2-hydroxyacyl-CoA dehydratase family protein [Candidatus Freyarchaeota archaeon]